MIKFTNFVVFVDVINDLINNGKYVKLLGSSKENFYGALTPNTQPNTFDIELCAITDVGTIYFKDGISLKDEELANQIKNFFDTHSVLSSNFSFHDGKITVK